MIETTEYKPCPFCGCEEVHVVRDGTERRSAIMHCCNCGCELESNEIGAGYFWNKRPAGKIEEIYSNSPCDYCRFIIDDFAPEVCDTCDNYSSFEGLKLYRIK